MNLNRKIGKIIRHYNHLVNGHGKINYKDQGCINFIDVGSSSGQIPDPWYENSKYIKNLLSFDPHNSDSANKNIIVSKDALWKERETRPFYIYRGLNQSGSSLFEQNLSYVKENFDDLRHLGDSKLAETWFERSEIVKTLEIEVETLDQVLDQLEQKNSFDFLKIDAQGAEFEILQGARKFLDSNCLGLQLELFNIPLYKGIKLEPEVTSWLAELGFKKVKQLPAHGSFHSQNDFIYLKSITNSDNQDKLALLNKIYEIK